MKRLYDRTADSYDLWYTTSKGRIVDRIERENLYAYLKPQKGLKLLDVGCGTGQYSLDLARKGLDVVGVDISQAMLGQAREKAKTSGFKVQFIEADAEQLRFEGEIFDLVLSVTAFEFVSNLLAVLHESFRVLKSGGRLVVGMIGRNSSWWHYYVEKARRDPANVFNSARFYTLNELLSAMPGRQVQGKAALFVPPDFDFEREKEALALEASAVRTGRTDGGFICAMSVK